MLNNIILLRGSSRVLFLAVLFCACGRQKKHQASFDFIPPEVVEAKGYVVPRDKMAPPEIIPVKEITGRAPRKPKVIPLLTNIFPAGKPKIIMASAPAICIPGRDGFSLPEIVPAIDSPFTAAPPEIVSGNDPQLNDNSQESFSSFKVQQGLKTNWIHPVIQDKAGNLWISCAEGGISKYDGRSFTNYTMRQGLSSDIVVDILEDNNGNIWMATMDGGINKFDGSTFTHYTTKHGLNSNWTSRMVQDKKGNIWAGTQGGISMYDGKRFTHYTTAQGLISNHVRTIMQDNKGNIWVGTDAGISKFDQEGKFTNYANGQGLNKATLNCIAEDSNGNLWISAEKSGVFKFDGQQRYEHYSAAQGLSNEVVCILKDHSGNLWFGTEDRGIVKFDGKSFTHIGTDQGLNSIIVHSIAEDKTGNLWIGTNDGLYKYLVKPFTHFNPGMGFIEGHYYSVLEDKAGNIWAGIYGAGVIRFDGKSITHYTTDQGLSSNNVMCLLEDGNCLWIGTKGGGLNKYDGTSFTRVGYLQPQAVVFTMLKDSRGNIWLGTDKGLDKFDGKKFMHFGVAQGLSGNSITSICEDKKGNLWFGMEYDSMVNKLELPAAETGRYTFTHYNIHQGLISSICSIKEDKRNNLWFGATNAGVIKFDGISFTRYTTAQGLSNNTVNSIVEDNDDNLWFLTYNGLCKMPAGQRNYKQGKMAGQTPGSLFINYLYADGFLGVGGNFNSLILGRDGNIWAGADNRLTRYHPDIDIPDTHPPRIQLTGISLFGENINWQNLEKKKDTTFVLSNGEVIHDLKFAGVSKWYNVPQGLDLAHNNNYLTFQFIGITTNKPRHVRYQYRLEGFDENWSSLTDNPYATYNNLPHGSYTFKAKAVNRDGHWSNEFSYAFTIRPPWWKTWWFKVIAAGALIALLYTIMRWQLHIKFHLQLERSGKEKQVAELQQQKSELEMQALRAQMNPHFIFNSLNSINRFILQNNKKQASEYLTKFSKLVRMILQHTQASFIPLASELDALKLYLELEVLRFEQHFDFTITVANDLDTEMLKVPPLILQPFVENAIWHGLMHKEEKGQLAVDVRQEGERLCFTIEDNGIGRKRASELNSKSASRHKSLGLKITSDRIAMLHAVDGQDVEAMVAINDLVNADGTAAGTEVIIKIPVMYD